MTEEEMIAQFTETLAAAGKSASVKKSDKESYPYRTIDCCRKGNRGSIIGRMIPDKFGRIFDFIDDGFELKIPLKNSEGNEERHLVRWVDGRNYVNRLTPEQESKHNKLKFLMDAIEKLNPETGEQVWISHYKKLSIFFMKIFKIIPSEGNRTEYSNPDVTVVFHKSRAFIQALSSAYKAKNEALGDVSWVKDVFNRDLNNPSNYTVNVGTTFSKPSYTVTVNIDQSKPVSLTESDLDRANDLKTEFVNRTQFDEKMVDDQIQLCTTYLEGLGEVARDALSAEPAGNPDAGAVSDDQVKSVKD